MHLEQLECVVEVAKTGSLTNAAQNLHVTLSAVSQSISNLEAELGVTLFTRSRQGAAPTAEGQVIIKKAFEIIGKIKELKDAARDYASTSTESGELRLATIPGPLSLYLDTLIRFKKDYPQIRIEVSEKGSQEIIDDIRHNKADLGVIVLFEHLLKKNVGLATGRLLEGRMVACVSRHSPLSLNRSITPEELRKQSLALYNDDYVKWYMEQFQAEFGQVNVLFTTNNTDAIFRALAEGNAATVGLDFSLAKIPQAVKGDLVILDLEVPHPEPIYLGWIRAENTHFSKAAWLFIDKLSYELQKQ
ncbi:LysR family transcriptional regulator [Gordoniibacillus kamchatkensis]|uniref:LysR family transcriptional regulator n=1 Tax=Gordoniibacillus kamchatkensis TaxID=1590651 RepID=A0ABR5AIW4_9BACL|nr:LysR family transcriptional regulator [Paenibacillus sp. VKM B-2647]KIL40976.1 LysR family transcriptional regulator [Paenibacillus sp. VKM B-2647]